MTLRVEKNTLKQLKFADATSLKWLIWRKDNMHIRNGHNAFFFIYFFWLCGVAVSSKHWK
jgi:hypothetical protein